jgi:hypothetical protein
MPEGDLPIRKDSSYQQSVRFRGLAILTSNESFDDRRFYAHSPHWED